MSWSAALSSITVQGGNVVPIVTYTNSVTGETQSIPYNSNNVTPADLQMRAAQYIALLQARDAAAAQLTTGPIALTPINPAAADNFFALLLAWKQLQKAVSYGLIGATDSSVLAAAANMKAAFLPAYTSDPRFV